MGHQLLAEFMGTALMVIFGVGVHCDTVLNKTKYHGSGHLFAISTWGFGISVALFIFGNVYLNPGMVLAQCILGHVSWSRFIPYSLAEVVGGIVGAIIVWIMYKDHFDASADSVDPVDIRNIFSTSPGIRDLPRNFFSEFVATFIFITGILAIAATKETAGIDIGVGVLVWAVGMGLGGTTGFAMNLARDMGPRIAHALLPIKNKTGNDWQYGILVPGIAPFFGAAAAALFMKTFWGM
ncbi:D/L-lactic acid transporter LarD [Furfurilactobacillus entadae]|uniref:D/L-lactic acid transporter LarD n=1 Tax=Furfurilactobacillus entadae TaxID=2922307 RepID=UPI0035E7B94E